MSLALADLRLVEWDLATGRTRRELVPRDDVEHLVAAVLRLHHDPGVNPHNGRPAARLRRLAVGTPSLHPGYWWSAPSLTDDGPRARLVTWSYETRFTADDGPPDPV